MNTGLTEQKIPSNGSAQNGNGLNGMSGYTAPRPVRLPPPNGQRPREYEGWRAGKPAEDPEKTKRWGRINARPSEYLVHMRRGKVLAASSGQGASCFKLPGDSVAVVPTTVQKLQFTADQVTREKVGIEVTGLAVYRIAEPLIAYRMLNFSYPERAQEKLEELLAEMFVGAARRLVANLTVEECLTRRKEGIAAELMKEIVPVVTGHGRVEDATDQGWGIVIDTIEIQDVHVLSPAVFGNMQAPYRQEQERQAREAALSTERSVKLGEAEASRQIELSRLLAEAEVRERRVVTNEQASLAELAAAARVAEATQTQERATQSAEVETNRMLTLAKLEAELFVTQRRRAAEEEARIAELETETRLTEARLAHARQAALRSMEAEIEKVRMEAEADAARHAARMAAATHEVEHYQLQASIAASRRAIAEAELAITEIETNKARLAQELEMSRTRALREIENTVSPEVIQLAVAKQLPQLAAAFQQNMGEVHITSVDGANPFGYIASAIEGVMGLARSAGLNVPSQKTPQA
ncbi:MAG: SPFH domain-containing protein [Byssovorax sp.]